MLTPPVSQSRIAAEVHFELGMHANATHPWWRLLWRALPVALLGSVSSILENIDAVFAWDAILIGISTAVLVGLVVHVFVYPTFIKAVCWLFGGRGPIGATAAATILIARYYYPWGIASLVLVWVASLFGVLNPFLGTMLVMLVVGALAYWAQCAAIKAVHGFRSALLVMVVSFALVLLVTALVAGGVVIADL